MPRGGARQGSGRPARSEQLVAKTLRLTPEAWEQLGAIAHEARVAISEVVEKMVANSRKEKNVMGFRFSVRQPITSDPNLDREGIVISRHRTADAAREFIERELRALRRQPGNQNSYVQRYIYDEVAEARL